MIVANAKALPPHRLRLFALKIYIKKNKQTNIHIYIYRNDENEIETWRCLLIAAAATGRTDTAGAHARHIFCAKKAKTHTHKLTKKEEKKTKKNMQPIFTEVCICIYILSGRSRLGIMNFRIRIIHQNCPYDFRIFFRSCVQLFFFYIPLSFRKTLPYFQNLSNLDLS